MSKYGAKRTQVDGTWFASRKEARRYGELKLMERAGQISGLTLQPEFPIIIDGSQVRTLPDKRGRRGRPMKYTADFAYFRDGKRVVEEVKGGRATDDTASRQRRAIVQHIYHCDIEVVR